MFKEIYSFIWLIWSISWWGYLSLFFSMCHYFFPLFLVKKVDSYYDIFLLAFCLVLWLIPRTWGISSIFIYNSSRLLLMLSRASLDIFEFVLAATKVNSVIVETMPVFLCEVVPICHNFTDVLHFARRGLCQTNCRFTFAINEVENENYSSFFAVNDVAFTLLQQGV